MSGTHKSSSGCDLDQLLAGVAGGDPQALGRLLAAFRPELLAYVRLRFDRRLVSRLDPSDVVQEVQLVVAQRIHEFLERRPMPFHVWLKKTAQERLVDLRRHHRRQRRTPLAEAELPNQTSLALARSLVDPHGTPSLHLAADELAREMNAALTALDDIDREVLVMRHLEHMPFPEIGAILEIQPATARKRFGRALLRLQEELSRRGLLER